MALITIGYVPAGVGCKAPVPVRLIECGLPAALSEILILAVRAPAAAGANCALMEQLLPATRELPQVVVSEKSLALAPVRIMLEMSRAAFPVLLTVTLWTPLVVPTFCELKVKPEAERLIAGAVAGGCVPPPEPPPQAAQIPNHKSIDPSRRKTGLCRRFVDHASPVRIISTTRRLKNRVGKPKPDGVRHWTMGGALAAAVVVIVRVSVTDDALVTLTDDVPKVQVAPVGQPLVTDRLTLPVNPLAGVTMTAVAPP